MLVCKDLVDFKNIILEIHLSTFLAVRGMITNTRLLFYEKSISDSLLNLCIDSGQDKLHINI